MQMFSRSNSAQSGGRWARRRLVLIRGIALVALLASAGTGAAQMSAATTAPQPALHWYQPQGPDVASGHVWVWLTNSGAPSVTCTIDGSPFSCPITWPVLKTMSNGSHTLVATRDNGDGTTTKAVSTILVQGPQLSLVTPASGQVVKVSRDDPRNGAAIEVNVNLTLGTDYVSDFTFTCSLDHAPATACTFPFRYSNLAPGAHTLTVQGTGDAYNDPEIGSPGETDTVTVTHPFTVQ
jgi:hypothetical protein